MRVSIPGLPGVYYDTDSGSTAIGVASTAIGRKAPKPQGYAIQLLPYVWSFDVDLREVPNDHPIQYLHPEGARSFGELSPQRGVREAGNELESVLRFVWSVNQEVESTANQLIGRGAAEDGVVIEIEEGRVSVGGDELATDEFDLEEPAAGETVGDAVTTVEIADGTDVINGSDAAEVDTDDERVVDETEESDETDRSDEADSEDVFGATEEPPADETIDREETFGSDESASDEESATGGETGADDIDPDEP
ncbi:hypothetical protein HTZ84_18860 [Haloterrigena sp. SYSU A558-1]|uniref:Uncharacterized protein n=1 Tax=Haloterrigena gelatinilytica TaxID=2741724 RepID=A0A8J8GK80_9EURY|nr:hypothetical protein [Haloterrigena gelatinilytica]NUB89842.1 hypothetical protein [Haloterrigena gelatinilytica]NUC74327.1 hypothetical protein [Haloterrigena gelatinilytica]